MLEVENLEVGYGDSAVVQGASLRVASGQIVALLGRNGVGKTTLLRGIGGLSRVRKGKVTLGGRQISGLPAHEIARHGVRLVPQGRRLFQSLTVAEHLAVGANARGKGTWSAQRVTDLFPNLRARLHHLGTKLSGGEQTMVACGRALVGNPDFLLMDEPTEGLAPLMVRELRSVVGRLKEAGTSILLVEQNLAFALHVADTVYIMNKGVIVHHCLPKELKNDAEIKARYLGV